ncbi:MAG: FliM/FliN family flagellar motor switch protein [Acidobacteria bacterium]|nr:FliM/FliN family flagellar motor switch protein [Acidobacteriota bacterium]
MFRSVQKWDAQSGAGIPESSVDFVSNLHRPFARGLARSLSVYFRALVELEPSAAREMLYEQVAETLTPGSLPVALKIESHPSPVFVVIDAPIAAACLDLLLGGSGEKPLDRPELTEVDVQILSEMSRMVARELEIAWHELHLRLHSDLSVGKAARRLIPPSGRLLSLDFKMKLGENEGKISVLLNPSLVESMAKALNLPGPALAANSAPPMSKEFGDALSTMSVSTELVLPAMRVAIRDLVELGLNSLLKLPLRADQPAHLLVGGREIFSALPARNGHWRAAKIEQPIPSTGIESRRSELQ